MIRTGFLIFGFSYSQQRNDFGQADVAPLYLTGSEKEVEAKAVYVRAKQTRNENSFIYASTATFPYLTDALGFSILANMNRIFGSSDSPRSGTLSIL